MYPDTWISEERLFQGAAAKALRQEDKYHMVLQATIRTLAII